MFDNIKKTEQNKTKRIAKNMTEVEFYNNKKFSYLSDFENIKVGDVVTVEGHFENETGIVTKVLTSFKMPKFEMKWITSVIDNDITGNYFTFDNEIISFDNSLTAEKYLTLFCDLKYTDNPAIGNENLLIDIENFDSLFEKDLVKIKGNELYNNNAVKFISLNNGNGKAIIHGSEWYEIDFKYKNGFITFIACDCPYFGNCKHIYAFLLKMKDFSKKFFAKYNQSNFVMCDKKCFNFILMKARGKISLDL